MQSISSKLHKGRSTQQQAQYVPLFAELLGPSDHAAQAIATDALIMSTSSKRVNAFPPTTQLCQCILSACLQIFRESTLHARKVKFWTRKASHNIYYLPSFLGLHLGVHTS